MIIIAKCPKCGTEDIANIRGRIERCKNCDYDRNENVVNQYENGYGIKGDIK